MKALTLKIATIAALIFTALVAPAAATEADSGNDSLNRVSDIVRPSIVSITTEYSGLIWDSNHQGWLNDGEPFSVTSSCTGFFVSPEGHIASAAHCFTSEEAEENLIIAGAAWAADNFTWSEDVTDEVIIDYAFNNFQVYNGSPNSARPGYETSIYGEYSLDGEKTFDEALPARILDLRPTDQGDVAVIKVEATNTPALELASDDELSVGTPVVAIGHAGKVDDMTDRTHNASVKEGTVSSKRTVGGRLYSVYEISASLTQGMSGGPTVDTEGRVVGINSFKPAEDGETFGMISPVSELRSLLAAQGIEAELGTMSTLYRAGVESLYAGQRDRSAESFEALLEIEPRHALARDMLGQAKEIETGGLPFLPLLGLLGLVVGGAGVLRLRNRPAGQRGGVAAAADVAGGTVRGTTATGAKRPEAGRPAALVAIEGPLGSERFEVTGKLEVGRESGDLVIDEMEVSRRHAEFRTNDGELTLTDLGSANGTRVNGQKIEGTVVLGEGDRVQIGASTFRAEMSTQARRSQETVMRPSPSRVITAPHSVIG